jgi:hypothetical protein
MVKSGTFCPTWIGADAQASMVVLS